MRRISGRELPYSPKGQGHTSMMMHSAQEGRRSMITSIRSSRGKCRDRNGSKRRKGVSASTSALQESQALVDWLRSRISISKEGAQELSHIIWIILREKSRGGD